MTENTDTTPVTPMTEPRATRRAMTVNPFRAMDIGARAGAMAAQGIDVARLCLGEPDFGAPPAFLEAVKDQCDGRPQAYTDARGIPELRRAISGYYAARHGVSVDPDRILVTAGGSAALLLACALTVEEGSEVICADPSYPCNRELVRTFGGEVVDVPVGADTHFHLTGGKVAENVTGLTRAVMVTSPSNPTGTCIPRAQLAEVCAAAKAHGLWMICDETYLDLSYGAGGSDPTTIDSVLSLAPDAIVVSSFSKYWGMTGWRLGWIVLPERLAKPAADLATNYFLCAAAPVQKAAAEACFTEATYGVCEGRRREFMERSHIVEGGLESLDLSGGTRPEGAFYAYFDVSPLGLDSRDFCMRALDEAHVALTPGADFGPATAHTHVRLSYAASRATIAQAFDRLAPFIASLRRG